MKKLKVLLMVIMLLICATTAVWAQNGDYEYKPTPRYSDIFIIETLLTIDEEGTCAVDIDVFTKASSTVDKVKGSIELVNTETGQVPVAWRNYSFSGGEALHMFSFDSSYRLLKKGEHILVADIDLYDGTVLKESITVTSYPDSFFC